MTHEERACYALDCLEEIRGRTYSVELLAAQFREVAAGAAATEREVCARLCERIAQELAMPSADMIAWNIRQRGQS